MEEQSAEHMWELPIRCGFNAWFPRQHINNDIKLDETFCMELVERKTTQASSLAKLATDAKRVRPVGVTEGGNFYSFCCCF